MAHGFSAPKEALLQNFADRFAAAGFVVTVFDYRYLGASEGGAAGATRWENRVTLESIEKFLEYTPGANIHRISPTPLLMVVAEDDRLTPTDLAIEAYERAREPKKLVIFKGGHFDAYQVPGLNVTAGSAVEWFRQHLMR